MIPVYCSNNEYYSLNKVFEVVQISENDLYDNSIFVVNNGIYFLNFKNICDIDFIYNLILYQNREEEFVEPLKYIKEILNSNNINGELEIKHFLINLLHISAYHSIVALYNRNKEYYDSIGKKLIENVNHYNNNKIKINEPEIIKLNDDKLKKMFVFDNGSCYLPIEIDKFHSKTGRLNSNLFAHMKKLKEYFIPENDIIMELDAVAAEFRFLLFIAKEDHKCEFNAEDFWGSVAKLLKIDCDTTILKTMFYMWFYGASMDTISKKLNISMEMIMELNTSFGSIFPNSYKFLHSEDTKYWNKDNNIMYDYFYKELHPSDSYKKVNYFLQSSQSTHFQIMVNGLIKKIQEKSLQSKILFTVHDSLFIDLKLSEKQEFFEILKKINRNTVPDLLLTIKHITKKTNNNSS